MSANAFGCQREPFAQGVDLRFTYPSAAFVDGYNRMLATLIGRGAPILLIGEPGMGKTTVAQALVRDLRAAGWLCVAWSGADRIHNRHPSARELVGLLNTRDRVAMRLASADADGPWARSPEAIPEVGGEHTVLVIDDADDLPEGTLADLCREAIAEIAEEVSFRLLLIGSVELPRHVYIPAELRKRSAPELVRLSPLTQNEVAHYVAHRIEMAGGDVNQCFTGEALALIARYARGNPGTTNRLCAATLVLAEFSDIRPATAELVHEAAIDCWLADERSHPPEIIPLPRARPVGVAAGLLPVPPLVPARPTAAAKRRVEVEPATAAEEQAARSAPKVTAEREGLMPAERLPHPPTVLQAIKTSFSGWRPLALTRIWSATDGRQRRYGLARVLLLLCAAVLLGGLFAGGSITVVRWFASDEPRTRPPLPQPTPDHGRVAALPPTEPPSVSPRATDSLGHPEEVAILLRQGDQYIAQNDIPGARLYYEAAARRGNAVAAAALARTYDPEALALAGQSIALADKAQALYWYRTARDLGDPSVSARIDALTDDR